MQALCLYVDVPICAFRPHWSREYQDTYPFPPPATAFGMLLSLGGVDWPEKSRYAGVKLALAMEGKPQQSRVFRKLRRVAQSAKNPDPLADRRPDYQDLLLGLKFWIWIEDGKAQFSLMERVKLALDPSRRREIRRYGGLSLGESSHLVNQISFDQPEGPGRFLCQDNKGFFHFPVWVQHPRCGQGSTRGMRFSILEPEPLNQPSPDDPRWIYIEP